MSNRRKASQGPALTQLPRLREVDTSIPFPRGARLLGQDGGTLSIWDEEAGGWQEVQNVGDIRIGTDEVIA